MLMVYIFIIILLNKTYLKIDFIKSNQVYDLSRGFNSLTQVSPYQSKLLSFQFF